MSHFFQTLCMHKEIQSMYNPSNMYRRAENILTGGCLHLAYSLQSLLPNIAQNVQTAKQIFKFSLFSCIFLKMHMRPFIINYLLAL